MVKCLTYAVTDYYKGFPDGRVLIKSYYLIPFLKGDFNFSYDYLYNAQNKLGFVAWLMRLKCSFPAHRALKSSLHFLFHFSTMVQIRFHENLGP